MHLQESERLNGVLTTIRDDLDELGLGLRGDLTMTEEMDLLAKVQLQRLYFLMCTELQCQWFPL